MHLEAFLQRDLLDRDHRHLALGLICGQEGDADRILSGGWQWEVDLATKELIWHLDQDACAIPGRRVRSGGAAMVEVRQGGQTVKHQVVAGLAVQLGDERDTAGVMLECRVIQALAFGRCGVRAHLRSLRLKSSEH